jgi:hypothetical protein
MPYTRTLPDDVLREVANQVGNRVTPSEPQIAGPGAPQPSYSLDESFEVWVLVAGATKEYEAGNRKLSSLARASGVWHHQIKTDQNAAGFARSKPLGPTPDTWSLRELFWSSVAERVDEGIDWSDNNVPDEVEVRLLSVPFQQTEAFWFVTAPESPLAPKWNDKLWILIAPTRLPTLKPGTLIDSTTFLAAISSPVRGMGLTL